MIKISKQLIAVIRYDNDYTYFDEKGGWIRVSFIYSLSFGYKSKEAKMNDEFSY